MPHSARLNPKKDHESNIGKIRVDENLKILELCTVANVSVGTYCLLQNGMMSPIHLRGQDAGKVKPSAQRIIDVLNCTLSEAFPAYSCDMDRRELTEEQKTEITTSEESRHQSQYDILIKRQRLRLMLTAIRGLPPRTEAVLRMRFFEGMTLEETALCLGVQRERIRQIEAKALRNLKRPSNIMRKVKELWE